MQFVYFIWNLVLGVWNFIETLDEIGRILIFVVIINIFFEKIIIFIQTYDIQSQTVLCRKYKWK